VVIVNIVIVNIAGNRISISKRVKRLLISSIFATSLPDYLLIIIKLLKSVLNPRFLIIPSKIRLV
jgi:hypothetical protein